LLSALAACCLLLVAVTVIVVDDGFLVGALAERIGAVGDPRPSDDMWLPKMPLSELASSMPPATPAAVPSAPWRKLPPAEGADGCWLHGPAGCCGMARGPVSKPWFCWICWRGAAPQGPEGGVGCCAWLLPKIELRKPPPCSACDVALLVPQAGGRALPVP
jgi:hypothetical protein